MAETDIFDEKQETFKQCESRYMPEAYQDYDTQCGKPFGHVGEHLTKFKIPMVLEDGVERKALWGDVISTHPVEDEGVEARCTCSWSFGPSHQIIVVGLEAFEHAGETGHFLRGPNG